MNLGEIHNKVGRAIGDDDFTFITKDDITDWVNFYQLEIAKKIKWSLTSTQINSVSGTERYALPADFLRPVGVVFNGIKLRPVGKEQLMNINFLSEGITGTPTMYFIEAGEIGLYPIPSLSLPNGLVIAHTTVPADLALDADIPALPTELHNYLVLYCRSQAYFKTEDFEVAGPMEARCEQGLMSAIHDFGWQHPETYPAIGAELNA